MVLVEVRYDNWPGPAPIIYQRTPNPESYTARVLFQLDTRNRVGKRITLQRNSAMFPSFGKIGYIYGRNRFRETVHILIYGTRIWVNTLAPAPFFSSFSESHF